MDDTVTLPIVPPPKSGLMLRSVSAPTWTRPTYPSALALRRGSAGGAGRRLARELRRADLWDWC
jgi:hypothetical protein